MRTRRPMALITAAVVVIVLFIGVGLVTAQISTHLQNGERFISEGNWTLAVSEFKLALNDEPQNTTAWYGLGRAYEGLSGAKAAFDLKIEALTGISEDSKWEPTAEATANLAEAVKAYSNAVSFYPSNVLAIAPLGRAQYMSGRTQDALLTLERAVNPYQVNPDALAHLIYIGLLTGDETRVMFYSQTAKANQQAMADMGVLHALAAIELRKGDFKAAETILTPLMYRYDIGYLPLKAMGDCLLAQGRSIEALSFFRYAANLNPKAAGAWLVTGDIISLTGDPVNAATAYRSALLANPDSVWAKLGLARSLVETNDLNGALGLVKSLSDAGKGENLDSIYAYKGQIERALGQLQQAELSLKSAVALNSANPIATYYLNLVQTEMRSKGVSGLPYNGIAAGAFEGFVINGGAKLTNSRKVVLNVNITASYVAFKNENSDYSAMNFKFGSTASYDWLLSEGDGKKTVQMKTREGFFSIAKDGPLNEIMLDSTAPVISSKDARYITGNIFLMSINATDAMTGISSFWLSVDGIEWKYYRWIGTSFPFNLAKAPTSRIVSSAITDVAGNFAVIQTDISSSVPGPVITNVSALETGAGKVIVKWDTDRLSNSYVEYKLGAAVNIIGTADSTKAHSVEITGLISGQTYQFKPISTDGFGLKAEGQAVSLILSMPAKGPSISNVNVFNITASTATIAWTTDTAAYGYVVYTAGGQQVTTQQVGPTQSAQVTLSNLSQITSYQYQIVAWDVAGLQAYSDPKSFTTLSSDRMAPTITTLRISGGVATTGNRNVGIELYATDDSGYVVEMSFRDDASSWSQWQAYSTYANYVLSDRDGSRTLYARVRDAQGNVSAEATVRIILDRTAPKISWISAQAGADTADVTWDTDENADSWVLFGTSSFSLPYSMGQADSTRSHRVALSGLLPNTTYFYKVMSRDETGNSSESSVSSFRTQAALPSDTKAPTGSLTINDNSQYTKSRYVYLNLYATDDRSQQGEIQFRVGEGSGSFSINWGAWQSYTSRVLYTMSAGDGQRNIWVTYRDAAGNVSQAYGASVVLDTRDPGITGLQAYNITTTSAIVSFNTNELCFGSVEYGSASYSLSLSVGDSDAKSASVSSVEPSSVIITPNPVASRPGTTSFNVSITGLKAGTTYYYRAVAMDLAGNTSVSQVYSFQTQTPLPSDTKAPTGSITINDGTQYTRSRYIYLNLYATDDRSPQSEIQYKMGEGISTFNINWGNWQQFDTRLLYTMASGDGQRNIWVMYRDAAGNVSQAYVATVILDTRAPGITGVQAYNITSTSAIVGFNTNEPAFGSVEYGTASYSLSLVSGDSDVRSASVSSVEPSSVIITPNPGASRPGTTSFNVSITGLRAGTTYYYRAIAMDLAGNAAASQVYSFQTQSPLPVDTTPPSGSITINDGTSYTRSRYVYLSLTAQDNLTQQAQLQFRVGEGANSSNIGWGGWQQFESRVTYTMNAGDGQRSIWVSYKDAAGNVSQPYGDSIVLDTKSPTINNLAASNVQQTSVTVTFNTNEPAYGSVEYGTASYSLSLVSGEPEVKSSSISPVEPSSVIITPNLAISRPGMTSFSFNITGLRSGTTYYYRAVAMDPAGNTTASQVYSFQTQAAAPTDTQPPTGSLSINDGTKYTRSRYVYLNLAASDNLTQQSLLQYKVGEGSNSSNVNWGNWLQFASKVTYTMNPGDGQRNIWVAYKDAAGNVSQSYLASIILDTRAPAISNLATGGITQSSAVISWNTNEPTFGSVEFGAGPSSLSSVSGDSSVRSASASFAEPSSVVITPDTISARGGNTSFSINVTGLNANTTYYYKAVVMDLAGNVAASQVTSFKTASITVPPVIIPPVVTPPVVTQPGGTGQLQLNLASKSQGAKLSTNGSSGGNVPALANDENVSSFWMSKSTPDGTGANWLAVDFGKTVSFNNVVLKVSQEGAPKAFKVFIVSGNKLVEVFDYKDGRITGSSKALETITVSFELATTSGIRVVFYEVINKDQLVQIYELEVYKK